MKKINILFILPQLGIGGGELQTLKLVQNLNKEKYNIYLCNLQSNRNELQEEYEKAGAKIIPVSRKTSLDFNMLVSIRKFVKENNIHIVHSVLNNLWARVAVLGLQDLVVIASERSIDSWWKKWYHFLADNILALFTDKILCNAYAIKDFYKRKIPIASDSKFQVIYNAIEKEKYQKILSREEKSELYKKYDIKANKFIFVIVAGLRPVKNHKILLMAVDYLVNMKRYIKFQVLIIGGGQEETNLKNYVKEKKLCQYVKFLGELRDVSSILSISNAGIICSEQEGLSNAIIEYMTAGMPVIASDVGGNRELVEHEVNGYIFQYNDYENLAKYMHLLSENHLLAERFGILSKNKAMEKFDLRNMVKSYEELYDKCLHQNNNILI